MGLGFMSFTKWVHIHQNQSAPAGVWRAVENPYSRFVFSVWTFHKVFPLCWSEILLLYVFNENRSDVSRDGQTKRSLQCARWKLWLVTANIQLPLFTIYVLHTPTFFLQPLWTNSKKQEEETKPVFPPSKNRANSDLLDSKQHRTTFRNFLP